MGGIVFGFSFEVPLDLLRNGMMHVAETRKRVELTDENAHSRCVAFEEINTQNLPRLL